MNPLARRPKPKGGTKASDEAGAELVPHLPLLEKTVRSLARRKGLREDEAEDFQSWLWVKLIERPSVLEGFKGRSKWSTYLLSAVGNLYKDYRNAQWGKWRPSAAARRSGPTAVRLEQFLYRDGMPLDHAIRSLRENFGAGESTRELELLAARLPQRTPRSFEGEETLDRIPAPERTEARLEQAETTMAARRVEDCLKEALAALPPEDRLIVKMRWLDDHSVSTIARRLGLEQKPLYRRSENLLKQLRGHLERQGLTRKQVLEVFSSQRAELSLESDLRQSTPVGPSQGREEA
ncbi:MAG TPA: sigma-70 family RNA polymerase sigma factor [Thermoanaerobaculia bacterium]|nr:sigma-70 family RNA polymerase sigma factor [Thermoanaerobaculia bacterium]